jgi:hypothetical protein
MRLSDLQNRRPAMSTASSNTYFASLSNYRKGEIELISGSKKEYAFSNIFEVASNSKPYERVAVGKNLEYVQEAVRAEGVSPWYTCAHDEFAICMDGEVHVELVKLDNPRGFTKDTQNGAVLVRGEPIGKKMGLIKLKRGHQALLNKDAAYRFHAQDVGVLLIQTVFGEVTVERWKDICLQ